MLNGGTRFNLNHIFVIGYLYIFQLLYLYLFILSRVAIAKMTQKLLHYRGVFLFIDILFKLLFILKKSAKCVRVSVRSRKLPDVGLAVVS